MIDQNFWLWVALMVVILIGWLQYLHSRFKLHVQAHKLHLHQIDLAIARKYIRRNPQDLAAYVDEVTKAIDALPKG